MEEKKGNKFTKYIIGGVIILAVLFGGFKSGKYKSDKFWEREIEQRDSKIELSQKAQDSILNLANDYLNSADEYESLWLDTQRRNNELYGTIKRQQKLLERSNRDTSFINNAGIISNSVDRYYKDTDSIR